MTVLLGGKGVGERRLGEVVAGLQRCEARRLAGSPVVSLLVGSFSAALDAWRRFALATGRETVIVPASRTGSPSQECLLKLIQSAALLPVVELFIAVAEGRSVAETQRRWRAFTERDLEIAAASLAERTTRELSDACVWVIRRARQGTRSTVAAPGPDETRRLWETLGRLAAEVPASVLPAICIVGPETLEAEQGGAAGDIAPSQCGATWLAWASEVAALASAAPRWPLAATLSQAAYSAFERRTPESFARAMMTHDVLRLPEGDREAIRAALRERLGEDADSLGAVVERLAQEGATASVVECVADSAAAQKHAPQSPDEARSAQERLLFALLNADAETAGLFQLNAAPGLAFGSQPMEVDLLCQALKLAVEIDGYWHFQSPEHYRRDRRKDVALQQHDYFVARFLAEDVASDPHGVRDRVKEIVRRRRLVGSPSREPS